MKKHWLLSCLLLFSFFKVTGQTAPVTVITPVDTVAKARPWKFGGTGTLNFNQVSLSNWATGGQSSVSGLGLVTTTINYKDARSSWNNTYNFVYGLAKINKERLKKSDDQIDLTSKYGRNISKAWYYAAQLNFRSQFTRTLDKETNVLVSRFLAPAFILTSLGIDYKPRENFSVFVSAVTGKVTIVRDQTLADAGAFGVQPARRDTAGAIIPGTGDRFRREFGGYLNARFRTPLMENITFLTQLDLFSNYNRNPRNIDVNWQNTINMKVNKLISVSLFTHLIYDDDIMTEVDSDEDGVVDKKGPRVQFKETLGIGLTYKLPNRKKL
ncbi:DUF3078 domain-containing protein [Adhaeribacter pallidiroseus]|uniref:DUF3078 domain-containing protein n=1 Tax=Adhaeribacter pallidiroseus TaxID=2072847 RepID=A0A369QLW5_9BACT|nr:DUF3078 domain-containing protein [Adhaeribacter pallidiroseus]RDC64645.1 hypothetical protein AHMF7616_03261 [Adhaeribacter pallidiroseus]